MKQKFYVSIAMIIGTIIISLFFIFFGLFIMGIIIPFENPNIYIAICCYVVCACYILFAKHLIGIVIIDEKGIRLKELFFINKFISWKEVKDIGVGYNGHMIGNKWIYVSNEELTNKQKSKIEIVRDTKRTIKFVYTKKKLEIIKSFVERVNYTGKIELDDK